MLNIPPSFATTAEVHNDFEISIRQNNFGEEMEIVLTPEQALRLIGWINARIDGDRFVDIDHV